MDTSPEPFTSPSKIKSNENNQNAWRAGWWDVYPILEHPHKPIQWSQSSLIFTAHPVQAVVVGRHFSSSKQFTLPSATTILQAAASFEPPSIISVQPGDEWIFAYFPRRDGDGLGCLWKRGPYVDSWTLTDSWTFPRGGGVVAVSWISRHREWVLDSSQKPTRLPSRGPALPNTNVALLCITRDHAVQLCYNRVYTTGVRSLKRALIPLGVASEAQPANIESYDNTQRHVVHAAIGLGYNENTMLVATHSKRIPSTPTFTTPTVPPFNSMDLSVSMNLNQTSAFENKTEWEVWGEETTIEFFDVQIRFDGVAIGLLVLPSVVQVEIPQKALVDMKFISSPPRKQPTTDEPAKINSELRYDKSTFHLAISTIDTHQYSSPVTSTLTLYTFAPKLYPGRPATYAIHNETKRSFESSVICPLNPLPDFCEAGQSLLQVYELDTGNPVAGKTGRMRADIGRSRILTIPALSDHPDCEPIPLECLPIQGTRQLPLFLTNSQNFALIAGLPAFMWDTQILIYKSPKFSETNKLSLAIVRAILNKSSPSDVTHLLSALGTTLEEVSHTLYLSLRILDNYKMEYPNFFAWDILGVAIEIYRTKSNTSKDTLEKEKFQRRWQTAHDICSLAACNLAFDDCKEDGSYDLEVTGQLIAVTSWIIKFVETLAKECVFFSDAETALRTSTEPDARNSISLGPDLLHLSHPFTLNNLAMALHHIVSLREQIGKLPAGAELAHITKAIFVDAVDNSSVNIADLKSLIDSKLPMVHNLDRDDCHKALTACSPTPAMQAFLNEITEEIASSSTILNRSTLFIKPFDLVDAVSQLSIDSKQRRPDSDVVTKNVLPKNVVDRSVCLRCGGTSIVKNDTTFKPPLNPIAWRTWQQIWLSRCVCGGSWFSAPTFIVSGIVLDFTMSK